MVNFVKAYPNPVNRELLQEEFSSFTQCVWRDSGVEIIGASVDDEVTIDAIIASHDASQSTDEQTTDSASQSIKGLRSVATANAPFIASLMTWCLNADINSDTTATRFTNLLTTFAGQPTAVINAFKAGVLAEHDIDIDTIGIPSLTDEQKRAILRFARAFATSWAVVLTS
jgi:hypothetical protein